MSQTSGCDKLISLFEELDDGKTGFLPYEVVKTMMTEAGEKFKEDEWAQVAGDCNQDGNFPYRWYFQEILCNTNGIGDHKHWLKAK